MPLKLFSLFLSFCMSLLGIAQGRLILPDPGGPSQTPLELRQVAATVTLNNHLATTRIEHRFFNSGRRWEEATFYYPMPRGAHITSFEMVIQGKPTRSELVEASKARSIYEEIVRSMRDPALLEFIGCDLLKVRIFPIEAHSEKVITLTYQEILSPDAGIVGYRLPFGGHPEHPFTPKKVVLAAKVTVSQGLKTLWSPSHPMEFTREGTHSAEGSYQSQLPGDIRSFELFYSQNDGQLDLVTQTHTDSFGKYFLMQITPQLMGPHPKIPAKDLLFILDTSGSMAGEKLAQAKQALFHCLNSLLPEDRFAMIRFSTDAETFAPTFRRASTEEKENARQFVEGFEALGGTHMEAAFSSAKAFPVDPARPMVTFFITDGKPTIGERNQDTLIQLMTSTGSRIFPIGVGSDLNTLLLDSLAAKSGTLRTYVNNHEDLEFKVSQLFAKVSAPVMTGLELVVKGVRVQQMTPATLPDLYKDQTVLVMGTYQGQGQADVSLSGTLSGKRRSFQFKAKFPEKNNEHAFIPPLWAKRRVGYLLDQVRLHGEVEEVKEEIVVLAKRYGLITPYTSHLILEDEALRPPRPAPEPLVRRLQPRREEARRSFEAMRQDSGDQSVKASQTIQQYSESGTMAEASPSAPMETQLAQSGPTKFLQNRLFVYEEGFWLESDIPYVESGKETLLIFGSDGYFKFANQHPELLPILSLGDALVFQHNGKIYRVRPS